MLLELAIVVILLLFIIEGCVSVRDWFRKRRRNQAVEGAYRSRTGGRFRKEQVNHAEAGAEEPSPGPLVTPERRRNGEAVPASSRAEAC